MNTAAGRLAIDEENPWPGLSAFDEAAEHFFNGRHDETAALRRLVLQAPLTVLFGASGLGKTSLIQAGLFPAVRKEFLPVYIRLDIQDRSAPLIDQVKARLETGIRNRRADAPEIGEAESVWEYLHRAELEIWSEDNQLLQPLFVFDQFEEVFSLAAHDTASITRLRTDLADLIENRLPANIAGRVHENEGEFARTSLDAQRYRVVLTFREDFLPAIEGWKRDIPSLLRNRLRLLPMSGAQAFDAVNKTAPKLAPEKIAKRIVSFVAAAGETAESSEAMEVAPALLSLVCRGLNERRRQQGQTEIDEKLLETTGKSIIEDFYRSALAGLPKHVHKFIEQELITERGFRKGCDIDDARTLHAVTDEELALLVNRRLLRIEPVRGIERVELTHDLLTGVVRTHRERTRERARQRRRRILAAMVASVGLFLSGVAAAMFWFYLLAKQEAQAEKAATAKAQEALAKADAATTRATESQKSAEGTARDATARSLASASTASLLDDPERSIILALYAIDATRKYSEPILPGAIDALHAAILSSHVRATLTGHKDVVRSVSYSPDGKRLATSSNDGTAKVWDVATGRTLMTLRGHSGPVGSVVYSPDGKRLATASDDRTAKIWDAATGKVLLNLGPFGAGVGICFAGGGRWLAFASSEVNEVRLWDATTGLGAATTSSGGDLLTTFACSRDGQRLVTATNLGLVDVQHVPDGRSLLVINGPVGLGEISAIAMSGDNDRVALGGMSGKVTLWKGTSATSPPLSIAAHNQPNTWPRRAMMRQRRCGMSLQEKDSGRSAAIKTS
jgi:hypothetical protein